MQEPKARSKPWIPGDEHKKMFARNSPGKLDEKSATKWTGKQDFFDLTIPPGSKFRCESSRDDGEGPRPLKWAKTADFGSDFGGDFFDLFGGAEYETLPYVQNGFGHFSNAFAHV